MGYKDVDGNVKDVFFMVVDGYDKVIFVYEEMSGWSEIIYGVIFYDVLLKVVKNYI